MTGLTFTRLTVIKRAEIKSKNGRAMWECRCSCGNVVNVSGKSLRNGDAKSCGCYSADNARQRSTKHGLSKSRLYGIYTEIKKRCYNSKFKYYNHYGSRGIVIDDVWLGENGFESFKVWSLENGYTEDLTIDRIDVNGNYSPSNCRWVTMKEQQNNKRNNHILEYEGVSKTLTQWANEKGINFRALVSRIKMGWSTERLFDPVVKKVQEKQSGQKNISWSKSAKRWSVKMDGRHIGSSKSLEEAIEIKNKYIEKRSS